MCGINGFNWDDKGLIKQMNEQIRHRGSNDEGIYVDEYVSLGQARLAIIDLSPSGHQPMSNEDEDIWIIFNGEIYNFKEIRTELEKRGHKFTSKTDTEVVIHAYEEWGIDCVTKFNGMWAFAIYDKNTKKLILSRDRFGIKPLYYYWDGQKFIFSSEIKAILVHDIKITINENAISSYLYNRFVHNNETLFKNIYKVLPGQILEVDLLSGNLKNRIYYDIGMFKTAKYKQDHRNTIKELEWLLMNSVKIRLFSDVPLGVFLSGGIDSSLIAALASQINRDTQLDTFSVGFNSPMDELKFARIVAEHIGSNHHEIIVEPPNLPKILPKIIWHLDEPIADPATIPVYLMSEATKRYVTVVLTGEGADELFGGYPRYKLYTSYFSLLPTSIRAKIYLYSPPFNVFTHKEQKKILKDNIPILPENPLYESIIRSKNLGDLSSVDLKTTLPNYLLMKADKMSMAHALELRVPFLDYRVVEYSIRLPDNLKINRFTEKYILRKIAKNYLPKTISKRKKKGFPMPLNEIIDKDIRDFAWNEIIESEINKDIVNMKYIQKVFSNIKSVNPFKRTRATYQIFLLLYFSLWRKIQKVEWR